ncbi:unnamed protein product [Penicillium salamii]|uniref:Cellulose-binding protein n=1 Tax=Penicillium salamii TaxID=1612424 RepID=A0A9W4IUH4_9EURO|nr:unnamed protein product [Penicillium salamii]CAG8117461.1 unnamed protein product [Penicillium salamii]CAG8295444.1 unnamed protein product [Penicillium salamii]CAG8346584.1 unnamed protein product [Penicillium salamii]CAG8348556.1 unnamed protein product [Penicillium salamii]
MATLTALFVLLTLAVQTLAKAVNTSSFLPIPGKPRVFIVSDISNEPDDAESLTRYLLYSNQFQTEGIVAVTSTWLRDEVYPEDLLSVIDAYGNVTANLNRHAPPDSQYPSGKHMRSLVRKGAATYGMTAVGKNVTLSDGGKLLLERLEEESEQPLWVLAWGGTNVLAQVLYKIHDTYSATEAAAIRSRLRVYAISDQDDTGAWMRQQFPDVFYISSTHGWNQYGLAAWIGISGEDYYGRDVGGPDNTTVDHKWLRDNIQIGPYGKAAYPSFKFIMEGDTPTFLYLIQNGLGVSEQPDYGSWGGRYSKVNPSTVLNFNHYSDAADRVVGKNNKTFVSNQATIWRWRSAFQNDFAARMQWSLPANVSKANHHPVISVNGSASLAPLNITATAGSTITFNAGATSDPDGDSLSFNWFQYLEPGSTDWNVSGQVPALNVTSTNGGRGARVQIPAASDSCNGKAVTDSGCWLLHLILEVTDDGHHPLTSYRRILIQTTNTTETSS